MTDRQIYAMHELYLMSPNLINATAVRYLNNLLNYTTLNLISELTGVARSTFYRWLDPDVNYDKMNHRDAAWFIVMYETMPQIELLLDKQPSRQRLSHRLIDAMEEES